MSDLYEVVEDTGFCVTYQQTDITKCTGPTINYDELTNEWSSDWLRCHSGTYIDNVYTRSIYVFDLLRILQHVRREFRGKVKNVSVLLTSNSDALKHFADRTSYFKEHGFRYSLKHNHFVKYKPVVRKPSNKNNGVSKGALLELKRLWFFECTNFVYKEFRMVNGINGVGSFNCQQDMMKLMKLIGITKEQMLSDSFWDIPIKNQITDLCVSLNRPEAVDWVYKEFVWWLDMLSVPTTKTVD